ncbi:PH domain-like protein, partial [Backusella circina FSU 941]
MDPVARKKLNLEVLKRHDANICDILDQSPHCFDTQKNSWEKLGYEGVIFLTQGKAAPYFSLFVLNRLAIENFSLHLTDFEEINLNAEFIIYQTSEGEACALWLYEQKDRERI